MIPKWVGNIILIGVLLFILFIGYTLITVKSGGSVVNPIGTPNPTVNSTALAEYTVTPGPSSSQNATAVAKAKPTTYAKWTPADSEIFIKGVRDKAIITKEDINVASMLSAPGEGHVCIGLKTIFDIPVDTYCKISLTWTEWSLAYKPQDITVQVENGAVEADRSKMPLSADGTHYIQRPYARVTINVKDIGLLSPGTRFDQKFNFYKDLNGLWKLTIDLKEIILGVDLRNKANELTADADNLSLADSFAPLQKDGSRSAMYSDQLYDAFVANMTTPGDGHIYNRLLEYADLVANDRRANHDAGYAGLESLTVIVPSKPSTPCDYKYAQDMTTLVLPRKYCTYTFSITNLSDSVKIDLASKIVRDPESKVDYGKVIEKLLTIP